MKCPVSAIVAMLYAATTVFGATKYWSGTNTWNAGNTNWSTVTSGPYTTATFATNDDAIFEGTPGTVTVSLPNNPNSLTFTVTGYVLSGGTLTLNGASINTNGYDATISAIVAGSGGLTKSGSGMLTLSGSNIYTGATTINSGTLQIGNGATTGSISNSSNVTNNGTFVINLSTAYTYSGMISGTGTLQKLGGGTLSLSGSNTYTGTTTISSGTLLVTNTSGSGTGTGPVFIAGGATLGGTGTIAGPVSVVAGAAISPGANNPGRLTINNNLTLVAGSALAVEINGVSAGISYDQLVSSGSTVSLGNATLDLTLGYAPLNGDAYTIVNTSVGITGTFAGLPEGYIVTLPYGGSSYDFQISYTGYDVALTCVSENYALWNNHTDFKLNTTPSGAYVTAPQYNFPVLIRLTPSNFNDFANTLPGGADVRFAKVDGSRLHYEIERWIDGAANQDTAEIWVKVDTVRANDSAQFIRMYYGKTGAVSRSSGPKVFDTGNGFAGVWHLKEISGDAADATGNGISGTTHSGVNYSKVGSVGLCDSVDGTNNGYFDMGTNPAFNMNANKRLTVSAWVNHGNTTMGVNEGIAGRWNWTGGNWREFDLFGAGGTPGFMISTDGTDGTKTILNAASGITNSTWYYLTGMMDGTNMYIYLNGSLSNSTGKADIYYTTSGNTIVGSLAVSQSQNWNGKIDEVRIEKANRSADWIKLCYENQKQNQTLVQTGGGGGAKIWTGAGADSNWNTAANWSGGVLPAGSDSVVFNNTSVKSCILNMSPTVKALVFTSAYTGTFHYNGKKVAIKSTADFHSGGIFSYTGHDTIEFAGSSPVSFIKGPQPHYPTFWQNGTNVTTIQATGDLSVEGLIINQGTLKLQGGIFTLEVDSACAISGGSIDFNNANLRFFCPNVDLSSLGSFLNTGTSTMEFGGANQLFIPKALTTHPAVRVIAGGKVTFQTNGINTSTLDLCFGTINLGAGLTHHITSSITAGCSVGAPDPQNLEFNSSTLSFSGSSLDLNVVKTLVPSSGVMEFSGVSPQTFIPKAGAVHPAITQNGSGGTTVSTYNLRCSALTVTSGAFILSGVTDTATLLTINGGVLSAVNGALDINGDVDLASGILTAPGAGSFTVAGNWNRSGGTFNNSSGKVIFDGGPGQTIYFDNTFYKLQKVVTSPSMLSFEASRFLTVGDSLILKGTAGNLLSLHGTSAGTQWKLTQTVVKRDIQYVSVKDGYNMTAPVIDPAGSVNEGDNTGWFAPIANVYAGPHDKDRSGPVLSGQDSVPLMQVRVKAGNEEDIYLDTLRVKLTKGNFSKVNTLRLYSDMDTSGTVTAGDIWLKDTTVGAGDSMATFTKGAAHLESVLAGDSINFVLAMKASAGVAATDTFMLGMAPSQAKCIGKISGFKISGAGVAFDGDTAKGDIAPAITNVSSTLPNGAYGAGAVVGVTVTFNKPVTVSGGTPILALETGSIDRNALYAGGSGGATLTFNYTVQAGDSAPDLDYTLTSALTLAGATIKDSSGRNATLTLPVPGGGNSLSDNKHIRIDAISPVVQPNTISLPNGGEYWRAGSSQSITWNTANIADGLLKNSPIDLSYSTDGGATFPNNIVAAIAKTGPYSWTVPSIDNGTVRIRIAVTDSAGNTSYDTSDGNFTIDNSAPVVASTCLSSPNGGEAWDYGSSHTITWNTGDISDARLRNNPIELYYSTDGGATFPNTIATNLTNSGSYNWTVPSANSATVRVRINVTDSVGHVSYDSSNANFTIGLATLTVTGLTAQNKSYDGTNTATFTGGTLVGVQGGDIVSIGTVTGSFIDKNVGTGKSVTVTGVTLSGADAAKYTVTNPTGLTANITAPSALTVTGLIAQNKFYDGTNTATFTGGTLVGVLGSDVVTIGTVTGTFTDKSVGTSKSVAITGIALSGTDAANYTVSNPTGLTANITAPSALTVTGMTAKNKQYDGTITATFTGGTLSGVIGSDIVTIGTVSGTFADNSVGTGKPVTVSLITLTGADAANYTVTNPTGLTANITVPTAPAINIIATLTNDATPAITLGALYADSMRIALVTDTSTAVWKTYSTGDSIDVSVGGDGVKRVFAQYKDRAGNKTGWVYDSVTYDGSMPSSLSIIIADNNGYTNDAQPAITIGAVGADSMAFNLNGSGWSSYEPYAGLKTNLDISAGGNGQKKVYVKFRDLAGNVTSGSLFDSTIYDGTAPSVGSMAIKKNNGFTKDADPLITFTGVGGADSVRYGVNDSLIMGLWRVYAPLDSIMLGPEGGKRIWAQFRDLAGNQSARVSDTVNYDTTAPSAVAALTAVVTPAGRIALQWTPSVSPDVDSIMIRYNVTAFPTDTNNGIFWKKDGKATTKDTITGLSEKTTYVVGLFVRDYAGNWSAAAGSARASAYVPDMTPPSNVTALTAVAMPVDKIALQWTGSVSPDADSIMIRYRTDSTYPTDAGNGTLWKMENAGRTRDTVINLPEKTTYFFSFFVKDSSGLWSAISAGSQARAYVPDQVAPANISALKAVVAPVDKIALMWMPSASSDADSIMIRYRSDGSYPSDTGSGIIWKKLGASATTDTIAGLSEKVTYAVGLFVRDYAGNWSGSAVPAQASAYLPDVTPPDNGVMLIATAIDTGRVVLAWNPSAITAADADSVGIWYKTTGYPLSWNEPLAQLAGKYPRSTSFDTVKLSALGTLYFGLAVRDSSANWSPITPSACDTATAVRRPGPLSYNNNLLRSHVGALIPIDSCTNFGGPADSFVIAPLLPAGLAMDGKTGTIRGMPASVSPYSLYTIKAVNHAGMDSTVLYITIDPVGPGPLRYARTSVVCTAGVAFTDTLYNAGGPADTFTMVPPLPQGFSIDGKNGMLSGVPFAGQPAMTYIATGTNTGGSASCTVSVSTVYKRPKALFGPQQVTGSAPLSVRFADSSSGFITASRWSYGDGSIDSMTGPFHTYMNAGDFTVRLMVTGPGGSDTLTVPGCVTVTDTTIPLPVTGLRLTAINCSTAVVSWLPSASFDADSVFLAASLTDFPVVPTGGTYHGVFPNANVMDTLRGLPAGGVHLYASVFTKDFSANWSPAARGEIRLPDGIIPRNNLKISITSLGDTAIAVAVKTDSSATDADGIGWLCRPGTPATIADSLSFVRLPYRDSAFMIYPVRTAGLWYLSTAIHDSSGNISPLRVDTLAIANKPPVITRLKDVTISEDTLWQTAVTATDWNGDSLHFSLKEAPAGVTINPSTGLVSWTPGDSAVGTNRIVYEAGDFHPNGVASDTFTVTVLKVNKPPRITFIGDSTAKEDSLYRGLVLVSDPDAGDTGRIVVLRLPSWLTRVQDTVRGTPGMADVGIDTVLITAADDAGLQTTLVHVLRVIHTNHPPLVQRVAAPSAGYEDSALTVTASAYDQDAGDSLSFVWRARPSWLTLTRVRVVPDSAEWQFTLAGTPGPLDTGLVRYSFIVKDRAGAAAQVADSILIIARPNAVMSGKKVSYAAARYILRPAAAGDTSVTFVTKLTSLVDSTVIGKTIDRTGVIEYSPLVDGRYVFTASAVDASGLRENGQLIDTLVITNATTHTWTGDSSTWQMMSVPLGSMEAAPLKGSGYLVTWDESGPERDVYGYYTPSKEVREVAGGRSYWRKSADTVDITLDRESLVDTAITLHLSKGKYGWNMIADPYAYPVAWNSAMQAWKWNGGDFELAGSVLEPWQGYWVMAESSTVVKLDPKPVWPDSTPGKAKSAAFCVSRNEWRLKLALVGRTQEDRENAIGFNTKASDGFDRADLYEPPRMQGQGYIFFPHPEWKKAATEFASDIRRNWGPLNMFPVGIAPWSGKDSAAIRIEGYENLTGMYVFVRTEAGIVEYDAKSGIQLPPSTETRYLTLIVTADKGLAQRMPLKFLCGDPYPNPGRSMAKIRYTLPYEWGKDGRLTADAYMVKITIYDLAGRRIRDLVNHKQSAGSYEAVWDCKMNTGRIVGAGVFMYTIEAGRNRAIKRLTVLR